MLTGYYAIDGWRSGRKTRYTEEGVLMTTTAGTDWQAWQESWDRQQEWYLPDR